MLGSREEGYDPYQGGSRRTRGDESSSGRARAASSKLRATRFKGSRELRHAANQYGSEQDESDFSRLGSCIYRLSRLSRPRGLLMAKRAFEFDPSILTARHSCVPRFANHCCRMRRRSYSTRSSPLPAKLERKVSELYYAALQSTLLTASLSLRSRCPGRPLRLEWPECECVA